MPLERVFAAGGWLTPADVVWLELDRFFLLLAVVVDVDVVESLRRPDVREVFVRRLPGLIPVLNQIKGK